MPPLDPVARLHQAIEQHDIATAAQLTVIHTHDIVIDEAIGHTMPGGDPIGRHTPFDLASVTKIVATTLAAMLVGQGQLDLDKPLHTRLPHLNNQTATLRSLLAHRAGYPAWLPIFDQARHHAPCRGLWTPCAGGLDRKAARSRTLQAICELPAIALTRRYSDLGFIVLTALIEQVTQRSLDALCADYITHQLGLPLAYYRLSNTPRPKAPVTGCWRPREPAPGQEGTYHVHPQLPVLAPGEVDDDNAWAMDGVSAHAGVFGCTRALAALGDLWLQDAKGAGRIAPKAVIDAFLAMDAPTLEPARSLGFDRPAAQHSSLGSHLGRGPRGAVGHLGFTGTSLWIDLDKNLVIALNTNRTYPSRTATAGIRALRPAIHDAVAQHIL